MKLTDVCIEKPVFAWMLMAATVVFGGVAATRIGISQFPDVDFPTSSVNVTWEGAAPEVVENDAVEILEEALIQVEGVRSITSSSRQGGACAHARPCVPDRRRFRHSRKPRAACRPTGGMNRRGEIAT